jgi:hypothetical protein
MISFRAHCLATLAAAFLFASADSACAHHGEPTAPHGDVIFKPGADRDEVVERVISTKAHTFQIAFNGELLRARFYEQNTCVDTVVFTNRRAYRWRICSNGSYYKIVPPA